VIGLDSDGPINSAAVLLLLRSLTGRDQQISGMEASGGDLLQAHVGRQGTNPYTLRIAELAHATEP